MDAFLQDNPILAYLLMGYVVLFIIKTILCFAAVPAASEVLHRKMPEVPRALMFLMVVTLVAITNLFYIIPSLIREKHKFFLLYPKDRLIRDVLSGL